MFAMVAAICGFCMAPGDEGGGGDEEVERNQRRVEGAEVGIAGSVESDVEMRTSVLFEHQSKLHGQAAAARVECRARRGKGQCRPRRVFAVGGG